MFAQFLTWFHRFVQYLQLSCPPCCTACHLFQNGCFSWRDDKAIIRPIQKLSHAATERVTINFLQWRCLRRSLGRDKISLSPFIWKCIFHKWVCAIQFGTHSCARNPFDSLQRGSRAVSASRRDALGCDKLQQMTAEKWREVIVMLCWQMGIYHYISNAPHFTCMQMPVFRYTLEKAKHGYYFWAKGWNLAFWIREI